MRSKKCAEQTLRCLKPGKVYLRGSIKNHVRKDKEGGGVSLMI